jgi:hypothetical protein
MNKLKQGGRVCELWRERRKITKEGGFRLCGLRILIALAVSAGI